MSIREITQISMCVALLCVASYLVIPLPFTPIVLSFQTVIVNLIALWRRPKEVAFTLLLYLLMGLIGLPVFSAGTAGPGKLFGPTGGFYFGFLAAAILISLCRGRKKSFLRYCLVTILIGIPVQHSCALLFMCIYNGWNLKSAFLTVSLPFLVGDVLKCMMAAVIAIKLDSVKCLYTNYY